MLTKFFHLLKSLLLAVTLLFSANAVAGEKLHSFDAAIEDYNYERFDALRDDNVPVILAFNASWCSQCKAQGAALNHVLQMKESQPFVTMHVDWDKYKGGDYPQLKKAVKVPARTTLVIVRGQEELARVTGENRVHKLEAFIANNI